MHFSKFTVAATLAGLAAAADKYVMTINGYSRGDVPDLARPAKVGVLSNDDSAMPIFTSIGRHNDRAKPILFELDQSTGELKYVYPDNGDILGIPAQPLAASLISGGIYDNIVAFSNPIADFDGPNINFKHTFMGKEVKAQKALKFDFTKATDNFAHMPKGTDNLRLNGNEFGLCKLDDKGNSVLIARTDDGHLPQGCYQAFVFLQKVNNLSPPFNPPNRAGEETDWIKDDDE